MLADIRSRTGVTHRERYWRSLDELADTPEFQNYLHREFPMQASSWIDPVTRRGFLKLMGASLVLAGVAGCSVSPAKKIVPYTQAPEDLIPGHPLSYATALTLGGVATGVLVTSHMGRPTKIEGNPDHPASLGATDAFSQAAILSLYDPDRSQNILRSGIISSWGDFRAALLKQLDVQRAKRGSGLRILTETITSPTLADQIATILSLFPEAKWHQYEPVNRDNARAGATLAFGEDANVIYKFEHADVIISLGSDFLGSGPGHVRYAREFARKRQVRQSQPTMNRLYAIETTPTITGATADHRLPLAPAALELFAIRLAHALGVETKAKVPEPDGGQTQWISAITHDLRAHAGSGLVIAGWDQPPFMHALAHAINEKLTNTGKTVIYTTPLEAQPVDQLDSLKDLTRDIRDGKVEVLITLGSNPVYNSPIDFHYPDILNQVPFRVHLGHYADETARLSHWHIPQTHELESWSDARAYDGSMTIMQPLIVPLYGGKSAHELLNVFIAPDVGSDGSLDIVQSSWRKRGMGADFDSAWRKAVHDGLIKDSQFPEISLTVKPLTGPHTHKPDGDLSISFAPDPTVWDGRFANNGWLQELPKPLTRLTWGNAAFVSPRTAERLKLENQRVVELTVGETTLRAPVWIMPGQADNCITLTLGYGRQHTGRAGSGIGYNANALRTSETMWVISDSKLKLTSDTELLATTQSHHSMEGRDLVRDQTLNEFKINLSKHEANEKEEVQTLYPPVANKEQNQWGMLIDLNACTGCGACVLGCQSENNIPIVGKEEIARGREMHWLRIDRYYKGELDNPETFFEPVACVHCEAAPCEVVCPVAATSHSSEGLNQMIYNRCVGTRYCSNNCPYKVRRFNFLQYNDPGAEPLMLMKNPDVTVRERGVMEKCSYCVQRINSARIGAEKDNRPLRDGEIVTACQAACPSEAIVFGDINDPNSRVSKLKREPHNFGLLSELGTRPRTSYLSRVRNPNPELEAYLKKEHGV